MGTTGERAGPDSVGRSQKETRRCQQQQRVEERPRESRRPPGGDRTTAPGVWPSVIQHTRAHRDHSLAEHEDGVLAAWRAAAPMVLRAVLQVATTGLEANARTVAARCPPCQQRHGVYSRRGRQVQTRLGPIRLQRWWYQCWACAHGWSPPDRALALAPYQQTSTGLARWEATLGAITAFREATRLLAAAADTAGLDRCARRQRDTAYAG